MATVASVAGLQAKVLPSATVLGAHGDLRVLGPRMPGQLGGVAVAARRQTGLAGRLEAGAPALHGLAGPPARLPRPQRASTPLPSAAPSRLPLASVSRSTRPPTRARARTPLRLPSSRPRLEMLASRMLLLVVLPQLRSWVSLLLCRHLI